MAAQFYHLLYTLRLALPMRARIMYALQRMLLLVTHPGKATARGELQEPAGMMGSTTPTVQMGT